MLRGERDMGRFRRITPIRAGFPMVNYTVQCAELCRVREDSRRSREAPRARGRASGRSDSLANGCSIASDITGSAPGDPPGPSDTGEYRTGPPAGSASMYILAIPRIALGIFSNPGSHSAAQYTGAIPTPRPLVVRTLETAIRPAPRKHRPENTGQKHRHTEGARTVSRSGSGGPFLHQRCPRPQTKHVHPT